MKMGGLNHRSQIICVPNQISPSYSGDSLHTLSSSSRFDDNTFSTDHQDGVATPELAFPKKRDRPMQSNFFNEMAHEVKIATPELEPQPEPKPGPTVLTNYDVLFAPPIFSNSPNRKDPEYTLINYIGNRRFLVLINMYRPRYIAAAEQNDQLECLRTVVDIIKTVRQKCEPNGRFLQQDANCRQWLEIDDLAILVKIVEGELTKTFHSSEDGERPAKRARTRTVTLEKNFEPCYQEVARKKKSSNEGSRVDKPKPFDVICNITSLSLQENANHVGNNRLQVILDVRFKGFESSTHENRNIIVQDIVRAIIDDSSSQFLSLHVSSGTYLPLSRETAAICIKNALDSKLAISSEANNLVSRYHKKRFLGEVERRNNHGQENNVSLSNLSKSPMFVATRAA